MSQLLLGKISGVRTKHSATAVVSGISLAVIAFVVGLAVGMLLDWWLDLPRAVRAAFLAIDIALLAVIVVSQIVMPVMASPDDDAVALLVEDAHPTFRS